MTTNQLKGRHCCSSRVSLRAQAKHLSCDGHNESMVSWEMGKHTSFPCGRTYTQPGSVVLQNHSGIIGPWMDEQPVKSASTFSKISICAGLTFYSIKHGTVSSHTVTDIVDRVSSKYSVRGVLVENFLLLSKSKGCLQPAVCMVVFERQFQRQPESVNKKMERIK